MEITSVLNRLLPPSPLILSFHSFFPVTATESSEEPPKESMWYVLRRASRVGPGIDYIPLKCVRMCQKGHMSRALSAPQRHLLLNSQDLSVLFWSCWSTFCQGVGPCVSSCPSSAKFHDMFHLFEEKLCHRFFSAPETAKHSTRQDHFAFLFAMLAALWSVCRTDWGILWVEAET